MTPERWAQIRQIFDGALERPEVDRAAYLRVVCSRDAELRKEVESLLESHRESGTFLDQPAIDFNASEFQLGLSQTGGLSGGYPTGYRVGPYELQKCIGHGGMGSVWLASRSDKEFNQNVAVKLVKRGMDTQEILRRFRLERQVLAGLNHPNIATLIDGGSTADGLPYLVMEYVQGTRIDQYCESHKSTISQRLKLFRDVCAAVQYAHSNLVIHRDIKAGNILVTGEGVPKLLDFGIAKLLRTEFSTLAAAETRPEFRPMTLDYASPEQVRGEPITTATDVYSLGVLLYRVLTGKFPYGPDTKSAAALQQAICEKDPVRPSAVVLTDEATAIPEATQKLEIGGDETRLKARRRLKKKLAGDLDMIVLMALRKEPQRRYSSVEQFSEDIRRYLDGRPVIARSATFGYRTSKFLGRNAAAVIAAALVGLMLIAATVSSERSAAQAGVAQAVAENRVGILEAEAIRQEQEMMAAYVQLGELQESTRDTAKALATYRKALDAVHSFVGDHPELATDPEIVRGLAQADVKVGDLAPDEALSLYKEALAQLDILPDTSGTVEYMVVLRNLGKAQFRNGDRLAALTSFSRALETADKLMTRESTFQTRRDVAECNFYVGAVLARNGAAEAATAKLRKSLDLYSDLAGVKVAVKEYTAAGYEAALGELAAAAPADPKFEIQAGLAEFNPQGGTPGVNPH